MIHSRRWWCLARWWVGAICLVSSSGAVRAEIPRTIHYQGKLTEVDGSALVGQHTVTLRFYDAATGGTKLWEERHALDLARADGGLFSVVLGSLTPFDATVSFTQPLWLSVDVDGKGEFSPRQALSAVGYALNAAMLDGHPPADFLAQESLADTPASAIGARSTTGTAARAARADHQHEGLHSIATTDAAPLLGDVVLSAGSNVTLSQSGQTILISAIGGPGGTLTEVKAGDGLIGGGTSGSVTLSVGAGPGIVVESDRVSVDVGTTTGTVPDARLSSNVSLLGPQIESADIADGEITAADTAPTFLVAGGGVTLTKTPTSWQISAGGSGGTITGVVAGLGLTGGGTSGQVTLDVGVGPGLIAAADNLSVDIGTKPNQIVQLDKAGALPAVSGQSLTSLNASTLTAGTVPDSRLSSNVSLLGPQIESSEIADGEIAATDTTPTFLVAGSGVTLTKTPASWQISAVGSGGDVTAVVAGIGLTGGGTSGDLTLDVGVGAGLVGSADSLSVDVGTKPSQIVQLDAAGALPAVNGTQLTNLSASSVTSGTLADARLSPNVSLVGQTIGSTELEDGAVVQAKLATDSVGAAALRADAIQPGDITVGNLPTHASLHQPGGADAIPTGTPTDIGAANTAGSSTSLARADHVHRGVHSLAATGQPAITGDALLSAGSNVTLSQAGQTITITAAGATAGNRVSASASTPVNIGTADTDLIAVTITKSNPNSALLILASVQLNFVSNPNSRSVDLKLFRGTTQLDTQYTAQIGTANDSVRAIPVTLHAWDTSGAGTYTMTLRAQGSATGAQATIRRLSIVELL